MCSAKELELGDDDAGLFLLSGEPEIGQPITDVFSKSTTLELEITANREIALAILVSPAKYQHITRTRSEFPNVRYRQSRLIHLIKTVYCLPFM